MEISYNNFKGIIKQKEGGEWFVENIHPYIYISVSSKSLGDAMEYWKQDINYILSKNGDINENRRRI